MFALMHVLLGARWGWYEMELNMLAPVGPSLYYIKLKYGSTMACVTRQLFCLCKICLLYLIKFGCQACKFTEFCCCTTIQIGEVPKGWDYV